MTTEDLLKPRYKVIRNYPGSPYKIGDIKECAEEEHGDVNFYKQYPDVFSRIEWWEDRNTEDLPEYIKLSMDYHSNLNSKIFRKGRIYKVEFWDVNVPYVSKKQYINCNWLLPTTKEEYEQYQQSKK